MTNCTFLKKFCEYDARDILIYIYVDQVRHKSHINKVYYLLTWISFRTIYESFVGKYMSMLNNLRTKDNISS